MRRLALFLLVAGAAFAGVVLLVAESEERRGITGPAATERAERGDGGPETPEPEAAPEIPEPAEATCPPDAANCRAHTGRVLFVESVDPDGDGDLHLVTSGGSVTAPGITILDIRPELRPAQDPRIGDVVSGAGPVFPGSFGQSQIQVDEFRVVRPR